MTTAAPTKEEGIESSAEDKLKAALTQTIASIQKDPTTANVVFRASTSLKDGVRCSVNVRDFEPLVVDEPPSLGGTDAGMNPVELVLGALGTCQQIVYAAYASVLGIRLDAVSVECKGQLDLRGLFGLEPNARPGYSEIRFETRITSPEPLDRIQTLVSIAESRCPVLDILANGVPVRGAVVVNGERIHQEG